MDDESAIDLELTSRLEMNKIDRTTERAIKNSLATVLFNLKFSANMLADHINDMEIDKIMLCIGAIRHECDNVEKGFMGDKS